MLSKYRIAVAAGRRDTGRISNHPNEGLGLFFAALFGEQLRRIDRVTGHLARSAVAASQHRCLAQARDRFINVLTAQRRGKLNQRALAVLWTDCIANTPTQCTNIGNTFPISHTAI